MTGRIDNLRNFSWCQEIVDEVLALRQAGGSYTSVANAMTERGTFMTRNTVAGLLYREGRRPGLRHGPRPSLKDMPAEDTTGH